MYASSVASDIRCFSFGYSASLDRKKQYWQSMLQVDPLGFASRWKPGGVPVALSMGKSLEAVYPRDPARMLGVAYAEAYRRISILSRHRCQDVPDHADTLDAILHRPNAMQFRQERKR